MRKAAGMSVIVLFSLFLLLALASSGSAPDHARQYLLGNGVDETGALNLVTAIYLGYRAFDTLGETIVLITSVTGVVLLMGRDE